MGSLRDALDAGAFLTGARGARRVLLRARTNGWQPHGAGLESKHVYAPTSPRPQTTTRSTTSPCWTPRATSHARCCTCTRSRRVRAPARWQRPTPLGRPATARAQQAPHAAPRAAPPPPPRRPQIIHSDLKARNVLLKKRRHQRARRGRQGCAATPPANAPARATRAAGLLPPTAPTRRPARSPTPSPSPAAPSVLAPPAPAVADFGLSVRLDTNVTHVSEFQGARRAGRPPPGGGAGHGAGRARQLNARVQPPPAPLGARPTPPPPPTAHRTTQGTVTHMSPETTLEYRVTKASDVYAFGITLWELYTGGHAFEGAGARERVGARGGAGQKEPGGGVEGRQGWRGGRACHRVPYGTRRHAHGPSPRAHPLRVRRFSSQRAPLPSTRPPQASPSCCSPTASPSRASAPPSRPARRASTQTWPRRAGRATAASGAARRARGAGARSKKPPSARPAARRLTPRPPRPPQAGLHGDCRGAAAHAQARRRPNVPAAAVRARLPGRRRQRCEPGGARGRAPQQGRAASARGGRS